jgi:hypothetical protein
MNGEIVTHWDSNEGRPQARHTTAVHQPQESESNSLREEGTHRIVIAATFTADLLRDPLMFWMRTLGVSAEVLVAPYAQVMQELLGTESMFSQNKHGFNILLIRLEDWIRHRLADSVERNLEHVGRVAREFIAAVGVSRTRTCASTFVFFCPCSSSMPLSIAQSLEKIQSNLMSQLNTLVGVHCWGHDDLMRVYPVVAYEDTSLICAGAVVVFGSAGAGWPSLQRARDTEAGGELARYGAGAQLSLG